MLLKLGFLYLAQVTSILFRDFKNVKESIICGLSRAIVMDIDTAAMALKEAKRKRLHTGIGASDMHINISLIQQEKNISTSCFCS